MIEHGNIEHLTHTHMHARTHTIMKYLDKNALYNGGQLCLNQFGGFTEVNDFKIARNLSFAHQRDLKEWATVINIKYLNQDYI